MHKTKHSRLLPSALPTCLYSDTVGLQFRKRAKQQNSFPGCHLLLGTPLVGLSKSVTAILAAHW